MTSLEHDGPMILKLYQFGLTLVATTFPSLCLLKTQNDNILLSEQVIRSNEQVRPLSSIVFELIPLPMQYKSGLQSAEMYDKDFWNFDRVEVIPCVAIVLLITRRMWKFLSTLARPLVRIIQLCTRFTRWLFSTCFYLWWTLPMGCLYGCLGRISRSFQELTESCFSSRKKEQVKPPDYQSIRISFDKRQKEILGLRVQSDPCASPSITYEHANDANDLKEFEDSLKPTEEELERETRRQEERKQLLKEKHEAQKKLEQIMEDWNNKENSSSDDESGETRRKEMEEEFQRELDEQRRVHNEKMQEIREQREQIEREHEENMKRIQREAAEKMMIFYQCVLLKFRFEQKEQEVSDFLKSIKKPIAAVVISYHNLQNELRSFKTDGSNDKSYLESEAKLFAKKIINAHKILDDAFMKLEDVSDKTDNRIFVRMIMKSISEADQKLHSIGETLVKIMGFPDSKALCDQLNAAVSQLSPHSIPSTHYLRSNEPKEAKTPEKYSHIPNLSYPNWFSYFSN